MTPEEVRERVCADHRAIRETLSEVELLARRFQEGESVGSALRARALRLYDHLVEHIALEDEVLGPALREADGSERRARRLAHEHREQRELLRYLASRLDHDEEPTALVAREVRSFVDYVRSDMAHEEEDLLGPEILGEAS